MHDFCHPCFRNVTCVERIPYDYHWPISSLPQGLLKNLNEKVNLTESDRSKIIGVAMDDLDSTFETAETTTVAYTKSVVEAVGLLMVT